MSDIIKRFEALGMAEATLAGKADRMESDGKRIAELECRMGGGLCRLSRQKKC